MFQSLVCLLVGALCLCTAGGNECFQFKQAEELFLCVSFPATVEVGHNTTLKIYAKPVNDSVTDEVPFFLNVTANCGGIVNLTSEVIEIIGNETRELELTSIGAGRTLIQFECLNSTDNETCPFPEDYLKLVQREISIVHSKPLNIIIAIVGWLYFAAWTIAYYPQIFLNFWRRSVVGLNFDFLLFNITGFISYSIFNVGLFWIPLIQEQYSHLHPGGVNPVQLNDVIFALHATFANAFTIFQCFIFERGKQRVSYSAMLLASLMWLTIFITLFVSVGHKLSWLDFLYVFSYIKLAVTLVKYTPQAWYNFRRRSTVGWSIGGVLLDFIGGVLSVLQMILLSYNYDDWKSIFGDPTKFGLGVLSIMFDLIFMFQHYIQFRNRPHPGEEGGYGKINADPEEKSAPQLNDERTPLLSDAKGDGSLDKSNSV